ncbi:glycoside hydrolase family 30 beta sandwich domain-containing protein [Tunturiibacter empetritectus]|uniref:Glucosylceramidase n=1 Tax=Tunturiibacter lichenicola TaxID=2051959 RepID=A0A852VFB7_9BACT|nr:glucosylceramidase [Edaphobacter lichenicola]
MAVRIDPTRSMQSVLGFGGAFTDASCYLFSQMEKAARSSLMDQLYGPTGLNFSVGRTCIGASDYSRNAYSFDDSATPDPTLSKFSIEHDQAYILPTLREALAVNPELFLFSTPWSPPAWMKSNHSMLGGNMRDQYFGTYAQYFVKFIQAYQAQGVHVSAVTSQNEVDTDQDSKMPASLWGQYDEVVFVRDHLGPALRAASLDTKIWILDHNYDLLGRVIDELEEPGLAQYVDGVAWHGYMGSPEAMTRVHDAFPTKHAYWTEGTPDLAAPDNATNWTKWSATFTDILKNWARCIVGWNLVLDEKGMPNIGPYECGGLVTLDSKTQRISPSGQYWAFAHFSKNVRRGARVISTNGGIDGVEHVAFANPEGDYVLVLTNSGSTTDVACEFQGHSTQVHMPQNSVVTLKWT